MHTSLAHDDMDDLLARASDVTASLETSRPPQLTARDAARALVGVAGWVSRAAGVDTMQMCMAQLARHDAAWREDVRLADMPRNYDGRVNEHVAMIAVFASGLWPLFGGATLRSAVAFWATERDSSVWAQIAA